MEYTERYVSMALLGIMTLAFSPIAFAQEGAGAFCDRLEGEQKERCEERKTNRMDIHEECKDAEDKEAHRDCVQAAAETRGLKIGEFRRPMHSFENRGKNQSHEARPEISSDIREQMKACRDDNEDREDVKACMEEIRIANDLPLPPEHPRGGGEVLDEGVREQLKACRDDNEDREDVKTCMDEVREANGLEEAKRPRQNLRRHVRNASQETLEEFKACREEETSADKIACFKEVRENLKQDQ